MKDTQLQDYRKYITTIMQNVLSPYEVTPPEQYKTNKPKRMYWGLCHKKAYDYMMNLKDRENVVCCQGDIINPSREGMTGGHAWVELPGDIVFDGVLQRFYTREAMNVLDGKICRAKRHRSKLFDEYNLLRYKRLKACGRDILSCSLASSSQLDEDYKSRNYKLDFENESGFEEPEIENIESDESETEEINEDEMD